MRNLLGDENARRGGVNALRIGLRERLVSLDKLVLLLSGIRAVDRLSSKRVGRGLARLVESRSRVSRGRQKSRSRLMHTVESLSIKS